MRVQISSPSQQNLSHISVDEFSAFLMSKVEKIRTLTSNAQPPVITARLVATPFSSFQPVIWLIKRASDVLAPILSEICNTSLHSRDLPDILKSALVFPRLKKATLDVEDANSYRPISNLSFPSKFVQRVVARWFTVHVERRHTLFPSNQST